jgi:hypothetical protein
VKIVAGAIAFTLLGAALGLGIGWLFKPTPVEPPEQGLEFVNWIGPIVGGSVGATFGLIFGGGWLAARMSQRDDAAREA